MAQNSRVDGGRDLVMSLRTPPQIFVVKKWVKEQWGANGIGEVLLHMWRKGKKCVRFCVLTD